MDKNQNDGIKIEAKVSKDIIDGLSTDIVQRYDQKFSKIEKNGLNYYIVLTIMTCLIAIFILESNFDIYLKEKIVTSAEFNSRELLGQSPQLSSKIKILVKDDSTVSYMKKPFFSTNEWADLLKFVANYKPKAIYIDKLFAFIDPKSEKAIKKIASIDIPIYIMASIRRQKKVSGQNLDIGGNFYRPSNYFHQTLQDEEKQKFLKVSKFLPRENSKHIYSSNLGYRNLFISASTDYFSLRYFHPLLIVDSHSILPHLGIAGANNINLYPDQILINGNDLGLSNQKALINYVNPQKVSNRMRPISQILKKMQYENKADVLKHNKKLINPDDFVFIIPRFFTGSAQFHPTPFGEQVGALKLISVFNSSLMGGWIKEVSSPLFPIITIIISCLATVLLLPLFAWIFIIFFNLLIIGSGIYFFSFHDLAIPWLISSLSSLFISAIILFLKSKYEILKDKVVKEMKFEAETIAKEKLIFELNQRVLLQEKKEASVIASAFQPDPIPTWRPVKITGFHHCFDAASGDWFCFEKSPDDRYLHHIMCDITGHGVQAALIVSTCKSVLNTIKLNDPNITTKKDFSLIYLNILNTVLYEQGKSNHTTTFLAVTIEPATDKIHYLTCAHPPPILHKKSSDLSRPKILGMRNDPLGFFPSTDVKLATIDFQEGDKLVMYTDGVPINENFRVYKEFLTSNSDSWSELPHSLCKYLWSNIQQKNGRSLDDDVSIMIMERIKGD